MGRIFYILDELMIGLYFEDVWKFFEVFYEFVDIGNMIIVIEYNFEVIKMVDWIFDIGFEGGDGGGKIVVIGILEDVVVVEGSYIG